MIEWKALGLCASANAPFMLLVQVGDILVVGNHHGSSTHPHLLVPMKFLCACHKFASRCTLTLIGSI
jgi:hypothetical protein